MVKSQVGTGNKLNKYEITKKYTIRVEQVEQHI